MMSCEWQSQDPTSTQQSNINVIWKEGKSTPANKTMLFPLWGEPFGERVEESAGATRGRINELACRPALGPSLVPAARNPYRLLHTGYPSRLGDLNVPLTKLSLPFPFSQFSILLIDPDVHTAQFDLWRLTLVLHLRNNISIDLKHTVCQRF